MLLEILDDNVMDCIGCFVFKVHQFKATWSVSGFISNCFNKDEGRWTEIYPETESAGWGEGAMLTVWFLEHTPQVVEMSSSRSATWQMGNSAHNCSVELRTFKVPCHCTFLQSK